MIKLGSHELTFNNPVPTIFVTPFGVELCKKNWIDWSTLLNHVFTSLTVEK